MSFPRSIVHLDADAFFASVEQAADPRLRGKPIAVGGEKRGIIASASYEARKFGIYTPMPTVLARRLCPRLILLPGDFDKYELFSRLMFSYAYDFTPDVEIGSIDEGYFDVTGARKPALNIADTIRRAIRQALRLPVSEGIGSNKLISQIASKVNKPAAFQCVPAGDEAGFLAPLPNQWLPGVGPKTASQLNAAGLVHIGQIAQTPAESLGMIVGRLAPQLRDFARGIDDRPVVPVRAPAKSYSEQETFAADTTDEEFLEATLRRMGDRLMAKVRADGKSIRTLTVKVRYNDMDEEQASASLDEPTDLETEIYGEITRLLRRAWKRRVSLRLVSLKLSNLYDGRFRGLLALDAPARQHEAQQRLADVVDALREKYGRGAVLRGHDFILRAKSRADPSQGIPNMPDVRPSSSAPFPLTSPLSLGEREHRSPRLDQSKAPRLFDRRDTSLPLPKGEGRGEGEDRTRPPTTATAPTPCQLAVVQRQRLGHSAVRLPPEAKMRQIASTSPGAEFRFRIEAGIPARRVTPAKQTTPYVPLNVHSYYSFLDSTLSINAIVDLARRHALPAIALTDKRNLHGAVEFAAAATAAGIKAIIGAEVEWNGQRLCLYVENQTGYQNLCRILSQEFKVQRSMFDVQCSPPTDGLLAVSPAAELARFFPGRFYLEVNSPDAFDQRPAPLPCVASFPIHYESPADRWKYDVVQSIRTLTLLRQAHPEKRRGGEYHFRTPAEMQRCLMARPELLAHSREIADRCSFTFSLGKPQFPGYTPADGSTPADFLRRLVMEGLRRRYPNDHARLRPQLEQELSIITDVGYEEYFLVMWDILQQCRHRGIEWITRGSAADSLACYCLEISGVCPIRFDLYFRRFLNKDRMALNKLPDIDVDFPHDRKDDVIDLIFERFGPEQTAIVGGFSTFQSRSAFAEVAKVLGVSEFQVRRITERLPHFSRVGELAEVVAGMPECRDLPLTEEPYSSALQMAHFLDGFPRYPKMHPCGLVLSRRPMNELSPCFISAKGYPTTHFDMESVEALGLVKMDILAQGGLAVMRDVKLSVQSSRFKVQGSKLPSPPINLGALEPWDDPRVWEVIASGQARAVHHIESPAMISLCKMCNVRDIDTLIAIVSVIRPGAANECKKTEFALRSQGLSPVRYPHPSLEACLRSTCGLVVYEEHILQICEAFAGLPPGRADILRRALGKEKTDVIAQIQVEFADCARQRGRTEAEIAEVWNLVAGFRGYAFCKAHSTAYGVEAYQSAWLKLHYPAEFMAAVLTNGKGFYSPLVYVLECHRLGIPLLPPSVNQPGPEFAVVEAGRSAASAPPAPGALVTAHPTQKAIRAPLLQLKGLTQRTSETILHEHGRGPFTSVADFFLRVGPLNEEMDALIRVGAFDDFSQSRTAQYWTFKSLCQAQPVNRKSQIENPQLWLLPPANLDRLPSVPLAEPTRLQRLRDEEELLGYPASGHPLELFPDIAWDTYCPINRLGDHVGQQIVTCGLVIEQRLFHQVTGEPMKFITIADWTGIVETELFARTYKSYGLNTVRYRVLEVTATVEPFENGRGFTLRVLRADKPRTRK
ncbi:MAG TPA: DNA polymerase IV [Verrucomicrobiota bacterium]|nr:DNA polymerase IV [Verrucomicrobiota bacterium]HQL77024.1 DNA polymerase IV [Verrucomicrobiota bacterium]